MMLLMVRGSVAVIGPICPALIQPIAHFAAGSGIGNLVGEDMARIAHLHRDRGGKTALACAAKRRNPP